MTNLNVCFIWATLLNWKKLLSDKADKEKERIILTLNSWRQKKIFIINYWNCYTLIIYSSSKWFVLYCVQLKWNAITFNVCGHLLCTRILIILVCEPRGESISCSYRDSFMFKHHSEAELWKRSTCKQNILFRKLIPPRQFLQSLLKWFRLWWQRAVMPLYFSPQRDFFYFYCRFKIFQYETPYFWVNTWLFYHAHSLAHSM